MLSEQSGRGQGFFRGVVSAAGHDHVGLEPLIVARPLADPQALGAMLDGGVHVQVLEVILLVADDDVDVVVTAQAVVSGGEQAVHVRGQVDAGNLRILVNHNVDEARILVGEAVVVLAPDGGGNQQVDRGDGRTPGDLLADGQPLGVLVVHGVDDVAKAS